MSKPELKGSGLEQNPNIGALGRASYQENNLRVKGFSPLVVETKEEYLEYLQNSVLPVAEENKGTSRIIDRVIAKTGLFPQESVLGDTGLVVEAVIPLGGRWEGYDWTMSGVNYPGRLLSAATTQELRQLAGKAQMLRYEQTKPIPVGFKVEAVKSTGHLSDIDLENLASVFSASFKSYISDLSTPEKVKEWAEDPSTYPLIARNGDGVIVSVTSGDLGEIDLGQGRVFKFLEIGDSASNPDYRGYGLNRVLKALLIKEAKRMGFDSIHTETRASWGPPNFGNAKNGMVYCGTLPMNCRISGEEDVKETQDTKIDEVYRAFGSLNVWALTPKNLAWSMY